MQAWGGLEAPSAYYGESCGVSRWEPRLWPPSHSPHICSPTLRHTSIAWTHICFPPLRHTSIVWTHICSPTPRHTSIVWMGSRFQYVFRGMSQFLSAYCKSHIWQFKVPNPSSRTRIWARCFPHCLCKFPQDKIQAFAPLKAIQQT